MKRKYKLKNLVVICFIIICLSIFIYSVYNIYNWKKDVNDNDDVVKKIDDSIKIIKDEKTNEDKYDIDFETLKNENSDTVAYLSVNGTNINYVVVKAKDNDYYLKHNFNKKYNVAGWIFADYKNKFDNADKNIVIYGHNTKNGSMFGSMKNILKKSWQENEDNLNITLVTQSETYIYKVFSVYSIVPEDYYINTEFNSNEEYTKFLNTIKSRSIYDFKTNLNENDTILTLSTCALNGTRRVVLHAKKVN